MIGHRVIKILKSTLLLIKAVITAPVIILGFGLWELFKFIIKITIKILFFLILILIFYSLVPIIPDQYKGLYFFVPSFLLMGTVLSKLPWWLYFIQPQTYNNKK